MQIQCNGKPTTVQEGQSLAGLLEELNLGPETVVVELNTTIIDRDQYAATLLREGDRVELIRFVGGG